MRESFHTRLGFILRPPAPAVGLGNIWGFPTQVANHGGGAFLLVYLIVIFILAIPALYSEMLIGHHGAPTRFGHSPLSEGRAQPVSATMGF